MRVSLYTLFMVCSCIPQQREIVVEKTVPSLIEIAGGYAAKDYAAIGTGALALIGSVVAMIGAWKNRKKEQNK